MKVAAVALAATLIIGSAAGAGHIAGIRTQTEHIRTEQASPPLSDPIVVMQADGTIINKGRRPMTAGMRWTGNPFNLP